MFDEDSHSGYLETYIRNKRSRDPLFNNIKRKYAKRNKPELEAFEITSDFLDEEHVAGVIYYLKNASIRTGPDKENVFKRMAEISINRLIWIQEQKPTLTDIFTEYPVYLDFVELVNKIDFIKI